MELTMTNRASITIEVLTPTYVGSGIDAVLGVDAVVVGNNLYVIDVECVAAHLDLLGIKADHILGREENMERMLKLVHDDFTRLLLAYESGELSCRPYKLKASIASGVSLPPDVTVKLPQPNPLPASTIKGLLRTAIMYSILDNVKDKLLDKLKRSIDSLKPGDIKSLKRAGAPVEELLQGLKPHGRGWFRFDAARLLTLSDALHEKVDVMVYKFARANVITGSIIAAEYVVALTPGSRLKYEMKILRSPSIHAPPNIGAWLNELSRIDSLVTVDNIIKGLRGLSETIVSYELSRLRHDSLDEYVRRLEEFKHGIPENCFLLRIGYGAGHAAKTIVPWLTKYAPSLARELKARLSRHYGSMWDDATTMVIHPDMMGVGWVKLCIQI